MCSFIRFCLSCTDFSSRNIAGNFKINSAAHYWVSWAIKYAYMKTPAKGQLYLQPESKQSSESSPTDPVWLSIQSTAWCSHVQHQHEWQLHRFESSLWVQCFTGESKHGSVYKTQERLKSATMSVSNLMILHPFNFQTFIFLYHPTLQMKALTIKGISSLN